MDNVELMGNNGRLIPPHGGYRKLRSFQTAEMVYDGTVIFCNRFIDKRSRTHDQMVQAARSGVQNIAEGSVDSAISKKTELKLTGIARGSLPAQRWRQTQYFALQIKQVSFSEGN
jgi:four helix bundle protein